MIINRVSALLGARREKIQDFAAGAGLSYGTAFALYHDKVSRYDRETLDKLCRYFHCTVCELLEYEPSEDERPSGV